MRRSRLDVGVVVIAMLLIAVSGPAIFSSCENPTDDGLNRRDSRENRLPKGSVSETGVIRMGSGGSTKDSVRSAGMNPNFYWCEIRAFNLIYIYSLMANGPHSPTADGLCRALS